MPNRASILLSNPIQSFFRIQSFFHCAMNFLTVSMATSFHLFLIASLRFCRFANGSRWPLYTKSYRISQMQYSKRLRSGECDAHSSAAMKSRMFCRRNCCVTFAWCEEALCLAWRRSQYPDKVNDVQTVRKSSTDQCNGFGQLLFSADQWKRRKFFHSNTFQWRLEWRRWCDKKV